VVEAFSSELQGFVFTNVLDILGWGAALLVALLVEPAIRATYGVTTAASGANRESKLSAQITRERFS
jgi:hypothetical protein